MIIYKKWKCILKFVNVFVWYGALFVFLAGLSRFLKGERHPMKIEEKGKTQKALVAIKSETKYTHSELLHIVKLIYCVDSN